MFLNNRRVKAELGCYGGHLARVVGLDATDAYESVAALRDGIRREIPEIGTLVNTQS